MSDEPQQCPGRLLGANGIDDPYWYCTDPDCSYETRTPPPQDTDELYPRWRRHLRVIVRDLVAHGGQLRIQNAPEELLILPQHQSAFEDLSGTICSHCGLRKQPRRSFCYRDYTTLKAHAPHLAQALFQPFGDEYVKAKTKAAEWLKEHYSKRVQETSVNKLSQPVSTAKEPLA